MPPHKPLPMNRLHVFALLLVLSLPAALRAQIPLVWKGQRLTRVVQTWYPEASGEALSDAASDPGFEAGERLWATITVHHGPQGRPELVVVVGEENTQRVNFRYDDRGDLVERIHRYPDSTDEVFTWKYRYDEADRLTERSAFDENGKLMAQEVRVYDGLGRLTDHAVYVKRYTRWENWSFLDDENGLKRHDPRLVAYGPRYFRNDWDERLFTMAMTPFSLLPQDDVFQRYKYHYEGDGMEPVRSELFDPAGNLVEDDTWFRDAEGRLASVRSVQPMDSTELLWTFTWDSLGTVAETRRTDLAKGESKPLFRTEYETEGGRVTEKVTYKLGSVNDVYRYRPDGEMEYRETRDLFNTVVLRRMFDAKGRISQRWMFNDAGELASTFRYTYE